MHTLSQLPNKRLIAQSFSKAASTYDSVAHLQRLVGEQLLSRLPEKHIQHWLDLGCGTGFFSRALQQRYPQATGTCVDIAQGMLRHAKQHSSADFYLAGDAEQLPLASNSQDLIFSSLALQWCTDFPLVLQEAQRVLRRNGILAFVSLCDGTLAELKHSWAQVDEGVHVNSFRPFAEYEKHCINSGLAISQLAPVRQVLHYHSLRQLTHELKNLGAHNLNQGRSHGLTSRQALQQLLASYEQLRQEQGLPATWQLVYGVLIKEDQQ